MSRIVALAFFFTSVMCSETVFAGFSVVSAMPQDERAGEAVMRGEERRYRLRVGLTLTAADGPIQRVMAATATPMAWPEQQVQLIATEVPDECLVRTRRVGDSAEQMVLQLAQLARGSSVSCVRTYEVTRWTQRLSRDAAAKLQVPADRQVRVFLRPSEGIESSHAEIRRLANDTVADVSEPIDRIAALYDVTRERVRYEKGPFVGALKGLKAGQGDCEELSCLFVALCRATGVPARLVRGPGHAWAEFVLSDADGKLVWIAVDPANEPEFGTINQPIPIMHKGDQFNVPELPGRPRRILSVTGNGVGSQPRIEPIEEFELITPNGAKS
jgi:hypothetical protein